MKKYIGLAVIGSISTILISGCSGYGKLQYQTQYREKVTIQELIENSDDYHIHYFGYAINNSSGIMFDPKKDSKTLIPSDRWASVEGRERVTEVVNWLQIHNYPGYYLRLYKILGPDDKLYGYLFTGWNHVVFKVVDESTLFVYGLPDPPHYFDYGPEMKLPAASGWGIKNIIKFEIGKKADLVFWVRPS